MKPHSFLIALVFATTCFSGSLVAATASDAPAVPRARTATPPPAPQKDDGFLKKDGHVLMLHGKPFYEISFNKFDLFWQMLAAEFGRKNCGPAPVAAAERSLATLHDFGFKTIRIFLNDFGNLELNNDAETRLRYLQTVDRMLDLCDRYDIRVVASLGLGDEKYARAAGKTWVDLIANKDSQARKLAEAYARAIVERYKDRPTIAMWEFQNELLLAADIGGKERVWNKKAIPTLTEVVRFHKEMSAFIKSIDSKHLTTTGDSYRTSLWHQNQVVEQGATHSLWAIDSWEQLSSSVAKAQAGVDVFHIHAYDNGSDNKFTLEPDGSKRGISFVAWKEIAAHKGQPLYIGEWGALPRPKTKVTEKFWASNPDWFDSFAGQRDKARPIVQSCLDRIVADRVQLTHWWAFESERSMDQVPHRMDFTMKETPDFIRMVADANRRLQLATMGFTYAKNPATP